VIWGDLINCFSEPSLVIGKASNSTFVNQPRIGGCQTDVWVIVYLDQNELTVSIAVEISVQLHRSPPVSRLVSNL
jgi:hypothetical protein